MSELDARWALVKTLHDDFRRDMPFVKVLGKSLLPPPWSQARIDAVARLVVAAISCGAREELATALEEIRVAREEINAALEEIRLAREEIRVALDREAAA